MVFTVLIKWKGQRLKTVKLAGNYISPYLGSTQVGKLGLKNKGIMQKTLKGGIDMATDQKSEVERKEGLRTAVMYGYGTYIGYVVIKIV